MKDFIFKNIVYKKIFYTALIFFLFIPKNGFSSDFNLVKVLSDNYYYNSLIYQNQLYLSSTKGVFVLNADGEFEMYNSEILGPINILEGNIIRGVAGEGDNKAFKYLLPERYQSLNTSSSLFQDYLILTSRGVVFIYKKSELDFKKISSIRSISENYLGTYSGIFKNGVKIRDSILKYTDSYIREFDDKTFINWGGLSVIEKDTIISHFYSRKLRFDGQIEINGEAIGKAIDVFPADTTNYYLITTLGLYFYHIESQSVEKVFKDANLLGFMQMQDEGVFNRDYILFFGNDHIYKLNKANNEIEVLYASKYKIRDVYLETMSELYLLTSNSLEYINLMDESKTRSLVNNLELTHNVGRIYNLLYITSDIGLHIYDKNSRAFTKSIVTDELNHRAHFFNKDTLYLGGVNGLYTLSYLDIIDAISPKEGLGFNIQESEIFPLEWFAYINGLLLLIILIMLSTRLQLKRKIAHLKAEIHRPIRNEIEEFILANIDKVNVANIKDTFNLSNNMIYKVLDNEKPGDLIRKHRVRLVNKLRKEGFSEKYISKATGFSLSYLKKI